jgi:hypothetical protein
MGLLCSACPSSHEQGIENFITLLHLHITLPSKPDLHLAIYCRSLLFRGFKSLLWVRVKARRNVCDGDDGAGCAALPLAKELGRFTGTEGTGRGCECEVGAVRWRGRPRE